MVTTIDLPDWVRGVILFAQTPTGDLVPVLVDATGQLNILMRGSDALGTVRTIRVDDDGQLYAILRGASGEDVDVDGDGKLTVHIIARDPTGGDLVVMVDALGQLIMVPRGASGTYLDVDASGYLTAVLKGSLAGTLTTIAVDGDGRIQAFMMDAEDQWGQVLRVGNADLASRMGSLRTWDWRGNTLYLCDFSQGVPPGLPVLVGAGAAMALDPVYWRNGGYAYRLTSGSDSSHYVAYYLRLGSPPSSVLGFEVEFSIYPNAAQFAIEIIRDDGVNTLTAGLAVDVTSGQVEYYNSAGGWTHVGAVTLTCLASVFYKMKIVVDFATVKYMRGMLNDLEYDLSLNSCLSSATSGAIYLSVGVIFTGRSGNNDAAWLDNLIVTVNEPGAAGA